MVMETVLSRKGFREKHSDIKTLKKKVKLYQMILIRMCESFLEPIWLYKKYYIHEQIINISVSFLKH